MTSFRIRQWGSADWTQIDLSGDDEEVGELMVEAVRDMLADNSLHVQELSEEGKWEDL